MNTFHRRSFRVALLLLVPVTGQVAAQSAASLRPHSREWERLLAAEDARARTPAQLAVLLNGTRSPSAELRVLAVRALGRLERAELADSIVRLLRDPQPQVRAEAAHALGQALFRAETNRARASLESALAAERDPVVVAALAETLGRLRNPSPEQTRAAIARLVPLLAGPPAPRLGALRGLFFLSRAPAARTAFDSVAHGALRRVATDNAQSNAVQETRGRALAANILVAVGAVDGNAIDVLLRDVDPLVRREAVAAITTLPDTIAAVRLVQRALGDASGVVRYDAVRAYARRFSRGRGCEPLMALARDRNRHLALSVIDLLGTACPSTAGVIALLDSLTRSLPAAEDGSWHPAAHAIVSLAARAPAQAVAQLQKFVGHPNLFVRSYAATAATALRDTTTLIRLASNAHPNVRTVAVEGLSAIAGHGMDRVYLAQLSNDDSQLLMAAAAALDSSAHAGAAALLLDALDRVTRARRETSRDGRAALLTRVQTLGNATLAERVRPYLRDFDPQIANRAADVLRAWTGTRPEPLPTSPTPLVLPSFDEAAALERARVRIELADGGAVELRLFPFNAPTNAARFARQARAGYLNSLTLHRIAPNFVVQGGSPNANEYAGDGPFSRDELARPNWRGTVGLSTRGRDTGDGQIYFNLIDNVRLDHDYTIFAEILSGMDVVDRLLEGAVMRRVVVLDGR